MPDPILDMTLRAIRIDADVPLPDLAEMIDRFVEQAAQYAGVTGWEAPLAGTWDGTPEAKTRLLASLVATDVTGRAAPEQGITARLTARAPSARIVLTLTAASVLGDRAPLNQVMVRLLAAPGGEVDLDLACTLVQVLAVCFQPIAVAATTPRLAVDSCRSGWEMPIGRFVWIALPADRLDADDELVPIMPAVGGTLLLPSPEWEDDEVISRMSDVYARHRLEEMPRPKG